VLERTELEGVIMTARLGLGSRTSRIDGAADILTTEGSERDVQPVREAGLSALTGESGAPATRTEGFCANDGEGSQFRESRGRVCL
jgi:hypothetical protein